ncbi:MAG: hypothetical protein IKR74_01895 [Bacilli bacterium]|nr:hypothetical protein [Bacilli bacterium]
MFTKELMNKYANDLLFDLSEEEVNLLLEEFDVIRENMEIISNIEGISEVEPLSFPYDITVSSLRDDEDLQNISTEDALKNCHDKIEDVAIVPKVVG